MSKGQKTKYNSVLLIDDNEIDNYINERVILSNDFAKEVIVYSSGEEALEFLRSGDYTPDIIFLDLSMPIMDGFVFLQQYEELLKNKSALKEKTKIIVLSSSINPEDIDRVSVNPYVYKYINKPLSSDYLNAINY